MIPESLWLNILLLGVSLVMLYVGAEWLVRGSARIARQLRIRPMVIGLTVVAFATSAPEAVVGISGSVQDHSEIVLGDVIGANIANVGLIIGLSSLVSPLVVRSKAWRQELPVVLLAQVLLFVFCLNGWLGRAEGVCLMGVLVSFTLVMVLTAKDREAVVLPPEAMAAHGRPAWNVLLIAGGVAALATGGGVLVPAASVVARAAGMSELAIGLTVVAFGTTVPELAASTTAARQGEGDIAVGNAVGSVLLNTALVLGLASTIRPMGVAWEVVWVKLPVMIALVLALVPLMRTGFRVTRWEGGFLLACYLGFVAYSLWAGGAP